MLQQPSPCTFCFSVLIHRVFFLSHTRALSSARVLPSISRRFEFLNEQPSLCFLFRVAGSAPRLQASSEAKGVCGAAIRLCDVDVCFVDVFSWC